MDNILDHVVVQGQSYDIVSPTAFGDYIETIGSACINPDGYAQGSTFLAKFGNEQFYYEATAAITQGSAISEGTNCKRTTVTGREAELALEIENLGETVDSLNEALANEVTTRAALGAHNLLPNNAISQVIQGITWTVKNDGSIEAYGTASGDSVLYVYPIDNPPLSFSDDCILTGCPSGGDSTKYYIRIDVNNASNISDVGNGVVLPKGNTYSVCRCTIRSGQSIPQASPLVFKPMIRLASDTDTTYQPYAMTNRELTKSTLYFTSVACSATTGNFATVSNSDITADHVVVECTFANPAAITSDVTWTTTNGSLTLNGTCASATTANIILSRKGN